MMASGIEGAQQIRDLIEDTIHFGHTLTEWEGSIIVSLYTGKRVALERGNYQDLKLLDQVMKVQERVTKKFLRQQVRIDDMEFGLMPGSNIIDAIFIVRPLQEKFHVNKTLYMAFCRSVKGIRSCTQTCHLVGSSQAWCWGVADVTQTEPV